MTRVAPPEWCLAAGGAAVLIGLFLPWADGHNGFAAFDPLVLGSILIGVPAVAVPFVVTFSRLSDLPVVWETLLWLAALAWLLAMVIALLVIPPSLDHGGGTWLTLAGVFTVSVAGWRSVRREA